MNGCTECIVYQIHHNMIEADECPGCGKKTLVWKQSEFGTPHLECPECDYLIAVDLNTPCELDRTFGEKVTIIIEPQAVLPDRNGIIAMAKECGLNAVQMRNRLHEGFSIKMSREKTEKVLKLMQGYHIAYKTEGFLDLRGKYPFYRECGYPYSQMRFCLRIDNDS